MANLYTTPNCITIALEKVIAKLSEKFPDLRVTTSMNAGFGLESNIYPVYNLGIKSKIPNPNKLVKALGWDHRFDCYATAVYYGNSSGRIAIKKDDSDLIEACREACKSSDGEIGLFLPKSRKPQRDKLVELVV